MLGKSVMAVLITGAIWFIVQDHVPVGMFVLLDVIVLAHLFAPRQDVTMRDKLVSRFQALKPEKSNKPSVTEEPETRRARTPVANNWLLALKARLGKFSSLQGRSKTKIEKGEPSLKTDPIDLEIEDEPPMRKHTRESGWIDPYLRHLYEDENEGDKKAA